MIEDPRQLLNIVMDEQGEVSGYHYDFTLFDRVVIYDLDTGDYVASTRPKVLYAMRKIQREDFY